jgi:large subunit ribosomal protein L21
MIADGGDVKVGKPFIEGGKVTAEVAGHGRGDKVKIIKFRRRKHHMKRQGHRQWFTELKITGIAAGG